MKPEKLHAEAIEEYNQAAKHYAEINPELGKRFYREMDRLIVEILRSPSVYRRVDGPWQRHFSKAFPYAIIYRQEPEYIYIIAIMHMHREPGYWKHRVQ